MKEAIKERVATVALQHGIIKYLLQKHQVSEEDIMKQIKSIKASTDFRALGVEKATTDSPQKRKALLSQVFNQGTKGELNNSLSQMLEPVSAFNASGFLRSWRKDEKSQAEFK